MLTIFEKQNRIRTKIQKMAPQKFYCGNSGRHRRIDCVRIQYRYLLKKPTDTNFLGTKIQLVSQKYDKNQIKDLKIQWLIFSLPRISRLRRPHSAYAPYSLAQLQNSKTCECFYMRPPIQRFQSKLKIFRGPYIFVQRCINIPHKVIIVHLIRTVQNYLHIVLSLL